VIVRVRKTAELEEQAKILGDVAGYNQAEAIGRLTNLWAQCLRDQTEALAEKFIRVHLGPRGVEALLEAELGHRQGDLVLVRGARKEIEERFRRSESARRAALVRHGREVMESGPEAPPDDAPRMRDRVSDASPTESVTLAPSLPLISDQSSGSGDLCSSGASASSETPRDLKQQGGRKRKAPEVPMPVNFAPGEWHRKFAAQNGLDLDREFDRFVDGAEAKGRTYVSWPAALRTWLKNAVEWRNEKQAPTASSPHERRSKAIT
jgi:hypothetical protein